jgi:hypothetical protein
MDPLEREHVATKRGADELMDLCRWHYKKRPRELKQLYRAYASVCIRLFKALERRFKGK